MTMEQSAPSLPGNLSPFDLVWLQKLHAELEAFKTYLYARYQMTPQTTLDIATGMLIRPESQV